MVIVLVLCYVFSIFPTSRSSRVNRLAACRLLFIIVLLFTVVVSSRLCLVVLCLCVFYNVSRVINIVCWYS